MGEADYKFVFGTNLLNSNMVTPTPLWNLNVFNSRMAKGSICLGVGMGSDSINPNFYTKKLFSSILSKDYIHSTRDEKTAKFLRNMGLRAINTGCLTTWDLTNDFCAGIPTKKSDNVIFTLTDYKRDSDNDAEMIRILKRNYSNIYFWIQGIEDYNYFKTFDMIDGIKIVPPSLKKYDEILEEDVDFVGTRLHAGIRAMQHKKRALIIEVDNRATDMKKDINLNSIKRGDVSDELEKIIQSDFSTKLNIKEDSIAMWRKQFNEKD